MDEKVLVALEFQQVLALLAAETTTPPGGGLALALRPEREEGGVQRESTLTAEAARHLDRRGSLPFGTIPDPGPLLDRLEIDGSILAPLEVLDLLSLMKAGRSLKSFLTEGRAEYPRLWDLARDLPDLGNLIRFLDGKVATTGELEDRASDDLHSVRQEIRRRNERLKLVLDAIVDRPEVARALQDTFVSIRSERHVIPIRAEARAALAGIVHGVSGSGATVFVEPMETVDLNNEIVTLRDREAAEVQRLLQEYSDLLRGRLAELRALVGGIGRLDLVMARARLGRKLGGRLAETVQDGLALEEARHPLVEESLRSEGGRIVPLDLRVPPGTRVMMISGPNTGGKTVALKTVGLAALMSQCGLMVPAARAALPVFRGIFIDIGDRQSIPERLSTFSARMKTISEIASALEPPGLVLLDEVGTGTDPEEGAALAIAIVEHFREKGATVIATTHLEALKAYAATTQSCANAAMELDEATFTPTYRLMPGLPGRSGGLEIAERLGVPAALIAAARTRRGRSGEMVASYLAWLQEMTADLERRLRQAEEERARLEAERQKTTERLRASEEQQRRAVIAEIELALRSMREGGERYLASLEDRHLALAMRREEAKAAARLRAEARDLIRKITGSPGGEPPERLAPGAKVMVEGMGLRGTVESLRGQRVVILAGGKRMTVPVNECRAEPAGGGAATPGMRLPKGVRLERRPAGEAPGEIRLLGLTVDEALSVVDKYLDDACLADLTPVRLIHGVGSGRLKRAIAEFLARHPHVEKFTSAPADQGGAGVTIVSLKT
ncbi:MAG: Smr/MutS family protein [Acidobacteria bacterium]|nr:Smr/MutS family protein [Acidobacteriota bacterium]